MSRRNYSIKNVLTGNRFCEAGWFILQAERLLQISRNYKAKTALIYSALEARNAVEQIWFTLIRACSKGDIRKNLLIECRKTDGIFRIMRETEPDYRRLVRFTRICNSIYPEMPKVTEWDLKKLKRYWNDLSKYCHSPMSSLDTFDSSEWFNESIVLLDEVCTYVISEMRSAHGTGVLDVNTMPIEIRDAWETFKSGSASEKDVRLLLKNFLSTVVKD
jgi:hypothetical protein